jgi:hypothetical protein
MNNDNFIFETVEVLKITKTSNEGKVQLFYKTQHNGTNSCLCDKKHQVEKGNIIRIQLIDNKNKFVEKVLK